MQRDGEEAYLRVPVRELRETRDPGYQATLVALINCVLHNEPLPRRIHIRNVLNGESIPAPSGEVQGLVS